MKFLAFGLGVGAAIQAWRNFPADGPVSADMAIMVAIAGILLAYFGGKSRRPSAVAIAQAAAHAEATASANNSVNVAIVMPGQGAGQSQGVVVPDFETVSWSAGEKHQVTADDLDGLDFEDAGFEMPEQSNVPPF